MVLKRCTRCVMPETWAGISFDEQGVCNLCREYEKQVNIDWEQRICMLKKILEKYKKYAKSKGNKYDCIVGFSGGKDSTYTLLAAKKKYGMRPLVVTFDHGFRLSQNAEYNLMEVPKKLDCDHLRFTLGCKFRNALCRKGSEINGDFCWHCHNGVGAFVPIISKQWDIPLEIWGEPTGTLYKTNSDYSFEDFEEHDLNHHKKLFMAGITPEMVLPKNYEMRDFMPLMWPKEKFEIKALYLGNFERWDQRKNVDTITKELGWKHIPIEGTYVDWDKSDCPYEPVRDWQKFIKRGFGRTTFQASKDVREGLISRKKALKLVEKYDGKKPKVLKNFIEEVEISEKEFIEITTRHIVKK